MATQRKDFILALTEPYFLDRPLSLGGQALLQLRQIFSARSIHQRNYGFAIELRKPINPFLSISFDYRLEDIDIFDIDGRRFSGNPFTSRLWN